MGLNRSGGLLEKACGGVRALELPACIKDSELRYICVNGAYARFNQRPEDDFKGRTTFELFDTVISTEREDKEKRALVFATEETMACGVDGAHKAHTIRCERFIDEDGRLFLFEVFENMPSFDIEKQAAEYGENNILLNSGVLDLIDLGICIYDRDNRLIYYNARLEALYKHLDIQCSLGLPLENLIAAFYDFAVAQKSNAPAKDDAQKALWISERIAKYDQPQSEQIEQMLGGKWIRFVNRRLENGMLVGLRIDVTDFKDRELLLGKQMEETWLFREALEQVPVAVFMRDSESRLTFANAAYEKILGGDREKYIGMKEAEMFPDAGDCYAEENECIFSTGQSIEKAEIIPFDDGGTMPAITRIGRLITPSDERYLVGSITDVTLLKDREDALVAAQDEAQALHRELDGILQSLPVGVLLLDADLTIEYANQAFYDLWEVPEKIDLQGQPYRRYMELNYNSGMYDYGAMSFEDAHRERVARLQTDDMHASREVLSKSGKFTVISKTRIAGGKILSTYADITEIRSRDIEIGKTKRELQRVGEYMQDATGAMAQGLALIENGTIIMANSAFSGMLDVQPEWLAAGSNWKAVFSHCAERGDFGTPEEAAALLDTWRENAGANKPFSSLMQIAGERWVTLDATISTGNYWLTILTDVTEMKQREAELETLLARAEAADRAKSEFLANMSHEIRTPMNGVLGMAELLGKSNLDTRQKTFTDIIVKSGNALMTIINDILDFSKIDARQMKLRSAPFDPVEAVEDVASLLSSPALEKNIELIVKADPSAHNMISGDAGRFRQIVTNLIGNAVKFTETGHVLIELSAASVGESEVILTLRVEDTGIGIPAGKLNTIFEKFSQVDASSTRRHEGTGLGLAITVGLIGLFGGTIDVKSDVGKGSEFTVAIPFHVTETRSERYSGPISTRPVSVLVIEDNAINRHILTEQLTTWGVDSHAAESGQAGLAILNEAASIGFEIDAVILDYHMPQMNGVEVAKLIRADNRLDHVSIILLTSMDVVSDDDLLVDLNVQAHLMKPARARLLRTTLADVVRAGRVKRAMADRDISETPAENAPVPAYGSTLIDSNAGAVAAPVPAPMQTASKLDILVAEDNDVNQIVFTQILQQTGLRFRIVNNGKKAVQAWEEDSPSVILMDISMPVMNGHQATQAIRAAETEAGGNNRVPIIAVTAHALDSDRDLCLAAGMDDYLSKPISPELLEAKISKWLGRDMPALDRNQFSH